MGINISIATVYPKYLLGSLQVLLNDADFVLLYLNKDYIVTKTKKAYHFIQRVGEKNGEELLILFEDNLDESEIETKYNIDFDGENVKYIIFDFISKYPESALFIAKKIFL